MRQTSDGIKYKIELGVEGPILLLYCGSREEPERVTGFTCCKEIFEYVNDTAYIDDIRKRIKARHEKR